MSWRSFYLAARGALDRIVAALALVVLSPILIATALLVRASMGAPVLFRQERVGQYGRRFLIIKFRTMVRDAEQRGGGYAPPGEHLIPATGAFLRRTSLDELPQLVNILRGEIAFIGPRPALPDQYRRYTDEQRGRVSVPQGLTGLAQVRYRNNAPWSVRIQSDLEYVRRLGPLIDSKILGLTIVGIGRGTNVRLDQTAAEVDDLAVEMRHRRDVQDDER